MNIYEYYTPVQLESMTSEQLYKYCFISGNKEDWDEDFNNEILKNIGHYQILKSLSGEPLSYIKTKISFKMQNWIPEGKKLNPKLLYTLQAILMRNNVETRNSALTGKANAHVSDSCAALTTIINKSFDYTLGID